MAEKSVKERLEEIALKTAELGLLDAEEQHARRAAERAATALKNQQRQAQLASDVANRSRLASMCSHRQGASPSKPYEGKGDSALNVAKMPDGFTKRISCLICRLVKFSPHPRNMSSTVRPGETAKDRDARVAKYHADLKEFEDLLRQSKDKLTNEASAEMDCGVTIVVTNTETGMPILPWRPCDTYA